jgi:hypothetical protein
MHYSKYKDQFSGSVRNSFSKYVSQEMSNNYGLDILSLIKYSCELLGNTFSLSRL